MSSGAILVVSLEVVPGKEEEFNRWYDEHHIQLYAGKLPGLKIVRRYYSKRSDPQFMTIYEFESFNDLEKALSSEEAKAAVADSDPQVGLLIKSQRVGTYNQIFPK
jgi:antibiotic biosynthesis monooxygenase (ABM) superfamily enzyme